MTSQTPDRISDDSIDLRKLIGSLLRQWWIILGCVGIFTSGAAIFSFIIQPTVYQSTTGTLIPPPEIGSEFGFTPQVYVEFASSTQILETMRQQLGLQQTVSELRNQLNFELEKETFIAVSATAETAEEAFQIADAWSKSYPPEAIAQIESRYNQSLDQANQTVSTLRPRLIAKEEGLQRFNLEHNTDLMELRLASLEILLTEQGQGRDKTLESVGPDEAEVVDDKFSGRRFITSQLTELEDQLVDHERQLRELSNVSIPQGQAKVNSLTKSLASEPEFHEMSITSMRQSELGEYGPLLIAKINSLKELISLEQEFLSQKWGYAPIPNPVYQELRSKLADAQRVLDVQEALGLESNPGSPIPNTVYLYLQRQLTDAQLTLSTNKSLEQILMNHTAGLELELEQNRSALFILDSEALRKVESEALRKAESEALRKAESEALRKVESEATKSEVTSEIKKITEDIINQKIISRALSDEITQLSSEYNPQVEEQKRLIALEAGINSINQLFTVREPALPNSHISPQRTKTITLATLLGLMIGVGIAIIRDFYRSTISRSSYDLV